MSPQVTGSASHSCLFLVLLVSEWLHISYTSPPSVHQMSFFHLPAWGSDWTLLQKRLWEDWLWANSAASGKELCLYKRGVSNIYLVRHDRCWCRMLQNWTTHLRAADILTHCQTEITHLLGPINRYSLFPFLLINGREIVDIHLTWNYKRSLCPLTQSKMEQMKKQNSRYIISPAPCFLPSN